MKLTDKTEVEIIKTGTFREKSFGIGDLSIILDILRNRMYSDSIKALCQEVMSNARDAHRELGKPNVPIEVKIPNSIDKTFYIRDYGPGITPQRMADVFLNYGSSTKRTDDNQTGGFGLGAKTPFAYTDTFTIISITPEHIFEEKKADGSVVVHENCLVRRQYIAYIDESTIGKMALVTEGVTKDGQGTTVCITVEANDFNAFSTNVRNTAKYWDVRPIIKGDPSWVWETVERDLEGNRWFIEKSGVYEARTVFAIVDGIKYPIDSYKLGLQYGDKTNRLIQMPLRLEFKTGEIRMAADREKLEYDKNGKTAAIIKDRLNIVLGEIKDKLSEKIKNAKTLWEAKSWWKKISSEFYGMVDSAKWNNIDIDTNDISVNSFGCKGYKFFIQSGSLRCRECNLIEIRTDTILFEEDTGLVRPSRERGQTLCNMAGITNAYVIVFPDDATDRQKAIDALEKKFHFSLFNVKKMSTVAKSPIMKNGAASARGPIARVKEFHPDTRYKSEVWKEVDIELDEGDGIYVEINRNLALVNKVEFDRDQLKTLCDLIGVDTLHGIPTRFISKVGPSWVKLESLIAKKISDLKLDSDIVSAGSEVGYINSVISSAFPSMRSHFESYKFKDLIANKKHMIFEYIDLSKKTISVSSKINALKNICELVHVEYVNKSDSSKSKLLSYSEEIKNRYPLLSSIMNSYSVPTEAIVDYINMVDEREEKKASLKDAQELNDSVEKS